LAWRVTDYEATCVALAQVLAWQIKQQREEQGLTKQAMADRIGTSRSELDRLLHPSNGGIT
jgi:antitoxin HicB